MNRPVLHQVNLVSGDMEASLTFYRRLGLEIPDDMVWRTPSGAHHITASRDGASPALNFELDSDAFAQVWNAAWKGRTDLPGRVVVSFHVASRADVDAIYRDMTGAGYRGLQAPFDAFWGARYAILEDPDGIAVGLMSPIAPDRKAPPPDV